MTERGSCNMTETKDYSLALYFDDGYYNEEEEYQPIPRKEE